MDRRTFLAILLTAIVVVVTPLLFPRSPTPPPSAAGAATDSVQPSSGGVAVITAPAGVPQSNPSAVARPSARTLHPSGDTVTVRQAHSALSVLTLGAIPVRASLSDYRNLSSEGHGLPVPLEAANELGLLDYHLNINGTDVALDTIAFAVQRDSSPTGQTLTLRGATQGLKLAISYQFATDDSRRYLSHVTVGVAGAPSGTALDVALPQLLISAERDTFDDKYRHLAVAFKPLEGGVENRPFAKVDTGRTETLPGPLAWVAVRSKYFLIAVMAPTGGIARLTLQGLSRGKADPPAVRSTATFIVSHDTVGFDFYAGPQEFERLRALGSDLDQVNPYAGFTHSVVQPFATIVTRVLLWMKTTTGLGYGWVIVIFGVVICLLLWPLNQSAMRTSMRMQRLQPELAEVQARYKDPDKQREALIKLYAAHGMTPLSPVMGCLPMLLPMPVILALYFVFQNTIEFRGVSFLWLPDISAADPYYVIPLLMGVSMFALSWIGMRGTPPTPQTRMVSYLMPVMLTFVFFRLAAGLNLYYAVQNIAALPQQLLLSRERLQASTRVVPKKSGAS